MPPSPPVEPIFFERSESKKKWIKNIRTKGFPHGSTNLKPWLNYLRTASMLNYLSLNFFCTQWSVDQLIFIIILNL